MIRYIIMGKYRDYCRPEELDETNTREEADFLVDEYTSAFGTDWYVWWVEKND